MGAPSKRAKKVRRAREFDLFKLAPAMRAMRANVGTYAWDLDRIREARDAQMVGRFRLAARLAEASRTDYAIFSAFLNRLAPQHGLPIEHKPASQSPIAKRICGEAESLFGARGVGITRGTLSDIDGALANHGVAFGVNVITPREDGTRVDFEHLAWPIEHVWWDASCQGYKTLTQDHGVVDIVHGDGRWTIYSQHQIEPWKHGAILPIALVWGDHAFGIRDRSKTSVSHGNAKVVGTLPEGIALQGEDGELTPEATAMLDALQALSSADSPYGIKPFGSTIDYIINNSNAWQIFKEIIDSGDRAADRIYLGRDASVQAAGGDAVAYLFNVRTDIVEGALRAIERGFKEGVLDPWTAINFGDSTLAPSRVYLMPDADEDARRESLATRSDAFYAAIEKAKANGFVVDQGYVADLAKAYGVPMPQLADATPSGVDIFAYEAQGGVYTINELRARKGEPPVPWGNVSVPERLAQIGVTGSSPSTSGGSES